MEIFLTITTIALVSIAIDVRKIRNYLHDWHYTEDYSEKSARLDQALEDDVLKN